MSRSLVLLSGGIDSATALAYVHRQSSEVIALSFEYHLRPFREKLASYRLLQVYPAKLIETPLPFLKEAGDALPRLPAGIPEGYVSNRNLIFYALAAHFAELTGCERIVGGHTAEDREAFPDASPSFFQRLESLINEAMLMRKIRIELPLSDMSKLEVLRQAHEWGVPLQYTWSCYWDGAVPCGRCVSCTERAEAFRLAGLEDPLGNHGDTEGRNPKS